MKRYYLLLSCILLGCSSSIVVPPDFTGYTPWFKTSENPPLAAFRSASILDDEEYITCYWTRKYYQTGQLIHAERTSTSGWRYCDRPEPNNIDKETQ